MSKYYETLIEMGTSGMECNSDAHGGHAVSYVRFLVSSSRSDTRKRVVVFRAMPRLCRIRARSRQLYLG